MGTVASAAAVQSFHQCKLFQPLLRREATEKSDKSCTNRMEMLLAHKSLERAEQAKTFLSQNWESSPGIPTWQN